MAKKGESKAAPRSPAARSPAVSPAKSSDASPKKTPTALTAKKAPAVEELPRAIVRRLVKDKLSHLKNGGNGEEEDVPVQQDALLAFAESTRVFIHYLSATANDVCRESKRQTINAEDVLKAIEDIEFPEFVHPLKLSLEEFRKNNVKKSRAKGNETGKKRKIEGSKENGEYEDDDAEEDQLVYDAEEQEDDE